MSTASSSSHATNKRIEALQQEGRRSRRGSSSRNSFVTQGDAYSYALRTAYLHHLLQPKIKRLQHVAAPQRPTLQRQSTSVAELVKDFSHVRDSKSTQFPKTFMGELDKRVGGVITGQEKLPEFNNDPLLKRTFSIFLNEFRERTFRKQADQDRRLEILILKFFAVATKELQKGKPAHDESVKLTADHYVALFVRLISATLKSNDWTRDRPELVSRLNTLESKLLVHDQDLAADSQRNGGAGGMSHEVEVPRSGDVKDMHLVQVVASIFDRSFAQVQSDIDDMKDLWTEQAALQDLKTYQTNLNLNTKRTLRSDDFDTEEAYEIWSKAEIPDIIQMMNAIFQSSPALARSGAASEMPHLRHVPTSSSDMGYSDITRHTEVDYDSSYIVDQPVDMTGLNLNNDDTHDGEVDATRYTFIPPDPRTYFKVTLQSAFGHDLQGQDQSLSNGSRGNDEKDRLLSKRSFELLRELGSRWRIPQISGLMLFLDVAREKFMNQEVEMDVVDQAFQYFKDPILDKKSDLAVVFDRHNWTIKDYVLNQQILSSLYDAILRDLFGEMLKCFDSKPPNINEMMTVLEDHIYTDPLFSKTPEVQNRFKVSLTDSLREKAKEVYLDLAKEHLGQQDNAVEFYHVIQLGKAVLKLAERIQKRYRKSPEIMEVQPLIILVEVVLPAYVKDARDQISSIMHRVQLLGEEIPVLDGFELYGEMVEIRKIHTQVLPNVEFSFNIETLLEQFVWRWIKSTDNKIMSWVEGAVTQDSFQVRNQGPNEIPSDDDRHSVSVVDIFNAFQQSLDRILTLHWDDEYQYAKFMTALSRSFGGGVSRYCEVVEQRFIKEMDRLTPEREAQFSRSRQEKWMQMARDTISGKEKIEPFQFFPESLVKLNNIGYAMLQLDKLEKQMNVDACADVIRKYEPPPASRQRKTENLVFTIKIIEAEDLMAGDANGLSDPYVVLGVDRRKRIAKTRTIYETLNPKWEETIDITTQGPLNIVATVWDWDHMGDHDCLGRTTVKLDPQHFRDFLPHEYWLDLDTQGRLLIRVSMEGEKDEIQFYFGKAFRMLKRTERDMTRKITDKLSAYIQYCLSRRTLKSMTSRPLTLTSVSKYFNRNSVPQSPIPITADEVAKTLNPLFTYFNENFAIMKTTLTGPAMLTVMTRLWKEVLNTVESLLVPPLSDKPSTQRPLSEQELDIVFKWLQLLFDFFHAVDDEDPQLVHGVPLDVLKSPKYHSLKDLYFYYYMTTDNLIRTSERMASAAADRYRGLPPPAGARTSLVGPSSTSSPFLSLPAPSKRKSILLNRNLGTIRKAKEAKRREAQAEPNDDVVLRILRMRPDAARYLKDRSRQKERLEAKAAAAMLVNQSLIGIGQGPKR